MGGAVPIYDYQCQECKHRFELRQGFDADTVAECPRCGAIAERQISLVPVIFKGSGWYVNDHGKKKSTLGDSSSSNNSNDDHPAQRDGDGEHSHSHDSHPAQRDDHGSDSSATAGSVTESSAAEK